MEGIQNIKIGIMGGTGLDDPELFHDRVEKTVTTPFGDPSDALICGKLGDVDCVLLARHGRKHDKFPSGVNYRANLYALKNEGCTHVIVTTACGSLVEEVVPGHIVILDSFIDRTTKRSTTFYDNTCEEFKGIMHCPMSPAFCEHTRKVLMETCDELQITYHNKGTMVTVEGPRYSSKSESHMFRQWGAQVINMSTCPEVCLAKELGLCYASIALATDYDCWREGEESVSVEMVMKTFKENSAKAIKIIQAAIPKLAKSNWQEASLQARKTAMSNIM